MGEKKTIWHEHAHASEAVRGVPMIRLGVFEVPASMPARNESVSYLVLICWDECCVTAP